MGTTQSGLNVYGPFLSPAKINLFLHIVGRRQDGYHELQSVMRLLNYGDTLHFTPQHKQEISLTVIGNTALANNHDNLVYRAACLLQPQAVSFSGVAIQLYKRLPIGGGLGGGSSNAATTLLALNELWQCGLSRDQLQRLALRLGADVPFFVYGRDAFVEGIGERLSAIILPPLWYLTLTPNITVSTAEIFHRVTEHNRTPRVNLKHYSVGDGVNDLEAIVCRIYPDVGACLDWLKRWGDARMSGSGASVFVSFTNETEARAALSECPPKWPGFVASSMILPKDDMASGYFLGKKTKI